MMGRPAANEEIRFMQKVELIPFHECWEWMAMKDKDGYGQFCFKNKKTQAHRVSYALFLGDLIKGLMIDHICRNRSCVNPNHLRQVTPKQNAIENSYSLSAINYLKTHCTQGHEFTNENTYRDKRQRYCRTCLRKKRRARNPH